MNTQTQYSITLIGPAYPYRGGIAHFTETLYRGLRARGHAVDVVTFSRQYPELLFPGETQYEAKALEHPVPAERLIDSLNPLSWWQAARRVAAGAPDAVLFQYWMPFFAPAFGSMACYLRWKGVVPLAVVHNALPHERRPGDVLLSKLFLRACSGLVVLSKAVEADVQRLARPGTPLRRVEHPLYDRFGRAPSKEEAREKLGLPLEAPVLLFFGFIRRYKGLHTLLEAMPRVLERLPDVRLIVAGEFYDDEAPYRALIREQGLEDHVLLHSRYIPDDEVARYFAAADTVVQPYVSATQSGVAQVAFHFEKPLITTDVGGLAEAVEGRGLIVPPETPKALAENIMRFFEEEGLQESLTEGVRRKRQAETDDALYEAIEALVNGKG